MMKPSVELQDQGEALYFIANYHSMTSLFDPEQRRKNTLDVALDFLACGLDPKKGAVVRAIGCARGDRTGVAADDADADGIAGALPQLQGQDCARAFRRTTGCLRILF